MDETQTTAPVPTPIEPGHMLTRDARPNTAPVIVALDGRDHDADALALARILQSALGGTLLIAHVIPPPPLGRGMTEYALVARKEGHGLLARAAGATGTPTQTRLLETWPAAVALAELADGHRARVLVLGASHRGAMGRIVPGSTASHLVTRACCSVAVAPPGYAGSARTSLPAVGVAYNGTPEADLALAEAITLATALGVPMHLYYAIHTVPDDPSWILFRQNMHRLGEKTLDRGLRQTPGELTATGAVVEGEEAEVIAEASSAEDVGLLYVGSRGYGPMREAFVSGLVGGLLNAARCPLVIVPRASSA